MPELDTGRDRTIIRVVHNRDNPFVEIHRSLFEDTRLSWKAKAVLGYCLSRLRICSHSHRAGLAVGHRNSWEGPCREAPWYPLCLPVPERRLDVRNHRD